jgi:outer membrane murein-binding lipoprotein Lpp
MVSDQSFSPKIHTSFMKTLTLKLSIFLMAVVTLSGCISSQKHNDLIEQNRRLEAQLVKERQENAELNSFRFSLESQFKQKSEQYVKCQEDQKETLESMKEKYGQLLEDYNKTVVSYKSLNQSYEASKEANQRVIAELEEKTRQMQQALASSGARARKRRR